MPKKTKVIRWIRVVSGGETHTFRVKAGRLAEHRERQKSRNLRGVEIRLQEPKPVDNDAHSKDDDDFDWGNQSNENFESVY